MFIILNKIKNDPGANADMRGALADAEKMLPEMAVKEVRHWNLVDLAVCLESSSPFFVNTNIHYNNYPALQTLYEVIQKIPEFKQIDHVFCEFTKGFRELKNNGPSPPLCIS